MMRTLHDSGYDIEWHVVVLGRVDHSHRYAALAAATGGSFLAVEAFDPSRADSVAFLDAVEKSGELDDTTRRERQRRYELNARSGKVEQFEWFKSLPSSASRDSS